MLQSFDGVVYRHNARNRHKTQTAGESFSGGQWLADRQKNAPVDSLPRQTASKNDGEAVLA
jgi:hypothetical protein